MMINRVFLRIRLFFAYMRYLGRDPWPREAEELGAEIDRLRDKLKP